MSRRPTSFTPGLNTFLSKVATPSVLVLGILLLIYFNFNSVLKAQQVDEDQFHGDVTFSQGNFSYRFQENTGIDRPALRYVGQSMLSFAEWSSTVSVDGNVQELWNNGHGYDVDTTHNQIYNTISGQGWQLIEIVTLVNDHTTTVTFDFVARPSSLPGPTQYVFDIAHVITSSEWYNIQTGNGAFTAQVISGTPTATADLLKPDVIGTIALKATGVDAPTPTVQVQNRTTVITSQKTSLSVAQAFSTEYTVKRPSPFRVITLGTETFTFQAGQAAAGTPLTGSVALPGQQ